MGKKIQVKINAWSNISYKPEFYIDLEEWDEEEIEQEGGFDNWMMNTDWPHDYVKEWIANDISYSYKLVDDGS